MIAEPVFCVSDVDELELAVLEDDVFEVEEEVVVFVEPILDVELLTLVTMKLSSKRYEQKAGQPKNRRKMQKGRGCPRPLQAQRAKVLLEEGQDGLRCLVRLSQHRGRGLLDDLRLG